MFSFGDVARVAALADRGVLGRQAERVVAHRVQHAQAVAAALMAERVADRVVLDVPHVQVARGVGQHLEHVLQARGVLPRPGVRGGEGLGVVPDLLPLGLDRGRVVALHARCLVGENAYRNGNASPWRGAADPPPARRVPPWDPLREEGVLARTSSMRVYQPPAGRSMQRSPGVAKPKRAYRPCMSLRVQDPAQARVRAVLDRLAHELDAESAAAVLRQHVDVEQPGVGGVVGGHAAEADLPVAVVEADDARGVVDQVLHRLVAAARAPSTRAR